MEKLKYLIRAILLIITSLCENMMFVWLQHLFIKSLSLIKVPVQIWAKFIEHKSSYVAAKQIV